MVTLLSLRWFTQHLELPSFFLTRTTRELQVENILYLSAHLLLRAYSLGWLPDEDSTGCQGCLMRDNLSQPHVYITFTEDITVLHE